MARPKGSLNKISSGAKSNITAVFETIGGRDKMAEWAEQNMTEFYKLYGRLLPHEVSGAEDAPPILTKIEVALVNRSG